MTDQLTDEALAKRAEEIAKTVLPADTFTLEESFPDGWYSQDQSNRMNSYKFATLDALKVHRDGLRFMQQADHLTSCALYVRDGSTPWRMGITAETKCSCGRDQHIASLRELLGVSQ